MEQKGLIYRRRSQDRHQLVVPKSLIQDVIRANHDPSYIKRTHNVIALNYWWPGMPRTIADYVQKCDSCQRRKEDRQFTAPLATNARDTDQRIESLKASLRSPFRSVKWANRRSHQRNKKYHDRRAKLREFEVDLVYLYQLARRPGLSAKFFCPWTGPYQVTAKISKL